MSATVQPMIEVRDLRKSFGPIDAVNGISLTVPGGEVLGFLGPNGAGKSTTMKMITGFLTPSAGSVGICGTEMMRDPIAAKRMIGYLPEGAPAYGDMTPSQYLGFVAEIRGFRGVERRRRVARVAAQFHIDSVMDQPIETLSKGFKRRVGLAQALIHDPPVLIMDEPTDGLDPNQKHEVRDLIRGMAAEKAIIISTHVLEEVGEVCTRAVIIALGRIVADATPAQLLARSRRHNAVVLAMAASAAAEAATALGALADVAEVDEESVGDGLARLTAVPGDGQSIIGAVTRLAQEKGWPIDEIRVDQGNLDEVFRTLTTGKAA